jgi:hypothetical protein
MARSPDENEFTFRSETDRLGIVTVILAALSLIPLIGLVFAAAALVLVAIRLLKRRAWRWTIASVVLLLLATILQAFILNGGLNLHLIPG